MTKKLYHPSATVLTVLAATLLQACVGSKTEPVLSVNTPDKGQPPVEVSVPMHALQPEEKHGSAQQLREQIPMPPHLANAAPIRHSSAASSAAAVAGQSSLASSFVIRQPRSAASEGESIACFRLSTEAMAVDASLPTPHLLTASRTRRPANNASLSAPPTPTELRKQRLARNISLPTPRSLTGARTRRLARNARLLTPRSSTGARTRQLVRNTSLPTPRSSTGARMRRLARNAGLPTPPSSTESRMRRLARNTTLPTPPSSTESRMRRLAHDATPLAPPPSTESRTRRLAHNVSLLTPPPSTESRTRRLAHNAGLPTPPSSTESRMRRLARDASLLTPPSSTESRMQRLAHNANLLAPPVSPSSTESRKRRLARNASLPTPPSSTESRKRRLPQPTTDSKKDIPCSSHQVASPSTEDILKRLQTLKSHDLEAYVDCLKAVAKQTSAASAARVQSVLKKVYYKLNGARRDVKHLAVIKSTLDVIQAMQTDLAHFQRILGESVSATASPCLPAGCHEEALQIDFKRVSKIVARYPAMAEAVVPAILLRHKASLLHDESGVPCLDTTAEFIYDCLMAYPQHRKRLLSIIYEVINGLKYSEIKIIDVLSRFVVQHPSYAKQGVSMLNVAFCNPYPLVCVLALNACASMLHANPQCSQYVNQGRLYQAFGSMKGALEGSNSAMKALAQDIFKEIEACNTPFLREAWGRYLCENNENEL